MKHDTETKQKIIDAASHIFIERGMDGARMQDIADMAGINKALLHYYYSTKEQLYQLVATREIKQAFADLISVIMIDAEYEIWLRSFIHKYLQVISQKPQLTRFLLWEISKGGNGIAEIIREAIGSFDNIQISPIEIITSKLRGTSLRKVDPVQFFISLIGMCVFPFIAKPILENIFTGIEISSTEFIAQREEAIFELIVHGMEVSNA